MRRLLPLAVLALVSFAPAKDKKSEERIIELERQAKACAVDISAVDAGAREAFKKTGAVLLDVATAYNELEERVSQIERKTNLRSEER